MDLSNSFKYNEPKNEENRKNLYHLDNQTNYNNEYSMIKCTYNIKDFNDTQIINNIYKEKINKDIESKIKIWNNNIKEKLIFKRRFNKLGINVLYFIIEEKLNDMSFMFYKCSSLKKIEFISFSTERVTSMENIFNGCRELEYLDLSNFNTSNVTNMRCMFNKCH